MAVLEQWGVPLAVLGMLLLMLATASMVNRYQAYRAAVRRAVQRLERKLHTVSDALSTLQRVTLSRELRMTLRSDMLACLRRMHALYRRYPDIEQRLQAAETAVNAEGPPLGNGVGPIETEQDFRGIIGSIDALAEMISHGDTLQPIPNDVRRIFLRELGERRAEAMSRFHLVAARRYENAGELSKARLHLSTLLQVLRQRGPTTEFVRELYVEAEAAISQLGSVRMSAEEGAAGPNPTRRDAAG